MIARDADDVEPRYGYLDAVPTQLFDPIINHPVGALEPRVRAVLRVRDALLSGRLPRAAELAWPDEPLRSAVLDGLARSGIARHCDANPRLTDEILFTVLDLTRATHRRFERLVDELTAESWLLERFTRWVALPGAEGCDADAAPCAERLLSDEEWGRIKDAARALLAEAAAEGTPSRRGPSWDERVRRWKDLKQQLLDAQRAHARRRAAEEIADAAGRSLDSHMGKHWTPRMRDWGAIEELIQGVCDARGASRHPHVGGMLRAVGWEHSARFRAIMAGLPALECLLRSLGRASASEDADRPTEMEREGGPIRRAVEREREALQDGVVEVRGVERSAEMARMLASEAVLRLRPALRRVWNARYVERALMTYHAESVYTARIQTEQGWTQGLQERHRRAEKGPIIVVLDTSASMLGERELLAKATVLQVLCVAQLEGRACYVYNFGGSGQLVEHELSLDGDGLARAMAFLSLSFHGGVTNIEEALRRAVARLDDPRWEFSDLLVVTDGYLDRLGDGVIIPVDPALVRRVRAASAERNMRVHTALTVPLMCHARHTLHSELDGAPWVGVGDPHGSIKALSDHLHELSAWIGALSPSD